MEGRNEIGGGRGGQGWSQDSVPPPATRPTLTMTPTLGRQCARCLTQRRPLLRQSSGGKR